MTRSDDFRERGEHFRGDEWPEDEGPSEPHRRIGVGEIFPTMRDIVVGAASGDVWPTEPFDNEEER